MTQQKENFLKNTKDLDNITLFEMTSTEFANQLTDQLVNDMNISIVTIDGDHHYEHVVKDFDIAARLLNNLGGQIVVDDTNVAGVSQALNEFKEKFSSRISKEINAGGPTQVLFFKGVQ
jgi:cephalosporin hydroxylase